MDKLDLIIYETAHEATMPEDSDRKLPLAVIAEKMEIGKQVLINKVNYNNESNKLSLKETIGLMKATENTSILKEVAWQFGYKLVPVERTPEQNLLTAIVNVAADHGKVHQTIEQAFIDGRISTRELKQITDEIHEAIDAYHSLKATLEEKSL